MTKKTETTNDFETMQATPYYTCSRKGVYYHSFDSKNGKVTENEPLRLSDPINLLGCGVDEAGKHYRVIQWRDRVSQEQRTTVIAMSDIGANWGLLQGMGIAIQSSRRKRDLLADYLMVEGMKERYLITNQAGWCDGNQSYVLPNGEVLTSSDRQSRIIYNGDTSQAHCYEHKGTLEQWQQDIAQYANGNSRMCLALGTAFAAPLMRLLDIEGGGFHLFGDSSDGKTTVAKAALSVWGKADDLKLSWEGTSHGFSNVANAKNDNLLVLDEIGQAGQKAVSSTAYSVINGTGKVQGAKEGGNRHINQWRVLVLSTGEKTMEGFLRGRGITWHAGQENRLPSIPANAGKELGVFDTLHDFVNGAELSEHLSRASNDVYGVAGRAFIQHLLADREGAITFTQEVMKSFTAGLNLTGQARRVGNRMAIVVGALELATKYGVTGLAPGVAGMAIKQCFDAWFEREGAGKREDRQIIEQTEAFMQQNANSYRFIHWDSCNTTVENLAGYKKHIGKDISETLKQEYWIIPAVFEGEICRSFDPKKVTTVLADSEWLKRKSDRRVKHQRKGKGRFYVLIGETGPQMDKEEDAEI